MRWLQSLEIAWQQKYAKGSNEALGVEDVDNEADDEVGNGVSTTSTTPTAATIDEQGASSLPLDPTKEPKLLIWMLTRWLEHSSSSERLAKTIETLAKNDMDLPSDLYNILKSLPGFNSVLISFYYSHLVANPHIGRAFYNLPFDAKLDWVVDFINELKFPGN